ncbi:Complex I intermediate-associated protein 30 (CIA30) [Thalassovita gelatinovora]|uniref:Complex I intermediate-associated protein 30 (CIA30) n=1 Tax=Thalassovita gelatinovora TaxID=53501 RepID=A0A0P1F5R7_THAGE|nr:CIA30 family protein [Thalassovita gelatinovora]QIZ79579.1 NADH ubiquinone oxidoreductase [Thalassovita gelatinovora]CUH63067.1 Complex I intermediate-associated protein 30 (CIA30) [Thalassovita gelatinovora]SEQ15169.1 Complex I intermediate-associated protein 30 (CIA30) [Thalassovita gelatinovora]
MLSLNLRSLAVVVALLVPTSGFAEDDMIHFSVSDPTRWNYFSDQVMGGVSEGRVTFETVDEAPVLRLTGRVSTANRGGFIQARMMLDAPLSNTSQGIVLTVRGNDQPYYVHLRTRWTILPWQLYQGEFDASQTWQEVRIPFESFAPYGGLLSRSFRVSDVRSIAVVAFGRDHDADLSVRAIGVY